MLDRLRRSSTLLLPLILLLTAFPARCSAENYACPEGYLQEDSGDEHWCFKAHFRAYSGNNYDGATTECAKTNETLPIIITEAVNTDLSDRIDTSDVVWIGIVCDELTGQWQWQDGQSIQFYGFEQAPESNCIGSQNRFALLKSGKWKIYGRGYSAPYVLCARRATPSPGSFPTWAIVIIIVGIISIIIIVITIILIRRRHINARKVEMQLEIEKDIIGKLSHRAETLRYYDLPGKGDEWEIERRFVGIDYTSKIGEGAFGSVYLGRVLAKNIPAGVGRSIVELSELKNSDDAVAVKMLHENADTHTERAFLTEIDLMKKVGYHERLVNILACVTLSAPILLVSEYCENGDLLDFMRKRRKYMIDHPEDSNERSIITFKKRIIFAIQISYGLEFLSSQGFIHRDIAARNIMVDQQESCKIGDFGLCRAIEKEDENYHSQGGKLPLKWMSPEAIEKYHFSVASDVWSFGVLLFEIVTLGGSPYPDWPAAELLSRLKQGHRMERPDNCSEKLFEIMTQCWRELPTDRPTVTKLRKQLGVLLDSVNQDDYYLHLNADANYYDM